LNDIFDLEDVTKVWLAKDRVQEIGKNLSQYNAFDTGLFACTPYLFEVLEKHLAEKNDVSLSQGIQSLAAHQLVRTCDISDCFWQDVDTPESMKYAQKIMFQKLRKPTDGVVSRYFNRYISTSLTRLLVKTPVTANQITFVVSLLGILSGYFISSGKYWDGVIGGILFQLTSILDGCDGELSKLKLTASKTGEWLDTIGDNLTYLSFLVGVSMASHRILHGDFEVFEAAFMLAGFGFLMVVVAFYLIYHANSGTLMAIQKDFEEEAKSRPESKGLISFFGTKLKFLMKRDFFALFFMALCILDHVPLILHLSFVGVNATWIILLSYKRDIFKIPAKAKQLEERR
ncbi:MAG: hypothetical protein JNK65_03780, partial [Deltaproteobacteria bacterium]|nr:hypothetical protein [Deltaproteobacteria bacterium]